MILVLMMNFSIASAYTPKIFVEISDENALYNPEIILKLTENLNSQLTSENKFIVTSKEDADYFICGKIAGMGIGQLVNNPIGTAYTLSGSAASIFVSPFAGPIIGGIGMMQIRKNVFAIAVEINIIRCSDDQVVKKLAFLGKTNLKKISMSREVLYNTISDAAEIIAKRFLKDINKKERKIFIEPIKLNDQKKFFIKLEGISQKDGE